MTPSSSVVSGSDPLPRWGRGFLDWLSTSIRPQPRRVVLTDTWVALLVMVVVGFPFSLRADYEVYFDWGALIVWGPLTAALALRRKAPWIAFVLVLGAFILKLLFNSAPHGVDVAFLLILASSAAQGSKLLLKQSAAASVVLPMLYAAHLALFPRDAPLLHEYAGRGTFGLDLFLAQWSFLSALLGLIAIVFWLAGLVQRMQHRTRESAHAAELAEIEFARTQEQLFVEQERTQIARDMHDVVAHSLAVVVAQADGGRYLAKADPSQSEPVLQTISSTAREALTDVRALLAQLRHSQGDGPQKDLDDVDDVVCRLRAAGLTIEESTVGTPQPIGSTAELAVFRLVQEALTNALKYADLRYPTLMETVWSDALHLRIRNRVAPKPTIAAGTGHGLIGMRERILVVGGEIEVGRIGDDFEVRVRIPYADANPSAVEGESPTSPILEAPADTVQRPEEKTDPHD